MAELKFRKVNALPVTLEPDTVYFVKSGNTVAIHVSNNDGTAALAVASGEQDIHPFMTMGAGDVD
jgi:hypothetical protein